MFIPPRPLISSALKDIFNKWHTKKASHDLQFGFTHSKRLTINLIVASQMTDLNVSSSTTAGFVLGMAQTRVTPPARAAAVPVPKSSCKKFSWVSNTAKNRTPTTQMRSFSLIKGNFKWKWQRGDILKKCKKPVCAVFRFCENALIEKGNLISKGIP